MSTETYSPPPEPYTRKLLEQILSFNLTRDLAHHGCYKLSAINASKRREFINVVLHFDILSHVKKNLDEAPWIYCIEQTAEQPELDDLHDEQEVGKRKLPNTAIIICCCVIAALLLMVLILRCRSCILRRYKHNQRIKAQKFWYCNEAGRKVDKDRKHPDHGYVHSTGNPRVSNNQPANLFSWSEGTPLKESADPDSHDSQLKHWNRSHAFRQAQAYADRVEEQKRQRGYVLENTRISPSPVPFPAIPAETDSIRAHLAAGYLEYYKRQGKVLSETKSLSHGRSSSSKRNPTLREIYQLDGGSVKLPLLDSASPKYSIQSVRTTQPHNELSRSKLDSFNTSNHSFSSQSILLTGQRSRLVSMDSERASVSNTNASTQVGTRPLFTCESTSDLQWRSNDSLPMKESSFETYSDSRGSAYNTSVSSNTSTESNGAVITLNIPSVSVSTNDEQTMVFYDERNNKTFGSHPSIQVIRRPTVCLFSARKRPHRKVHPRHTPDHNVHLGLRPYPESPKSAATLTPVRSNQHTPTHATGLRPHSHSAEAKSWSNLKDSEGGHFPDSASYLSAGSTLSPPQTGIDLPDVYLYPPSMSSLQSVQGSMIIPPYNDDQSRAKGQVPVSQSCVSMRNGELVLNGYENHLFREAPSSDIYTSHDAKIWAGSDSLETGDTQSNDLSHSRKQSSGIVRKEFLHRDSNTSKNSSVDFSSPSLRNGKHRRMSPKDLEPPAGLNRSKRAISLTLRPKSSKSLGAELQTIFDRHYEMTGIRMLAVSPTNPPRSSLDSNPGLFDWTNRNKLEKRRQSCSFGIDDINSRLTSGMKAAVSALHLDCFRSDDLLPKKNTPSVLSSLATTALPCMAPVRSRIPLATGLQKNINGSAPPMRRSSSLFPKVFTSPIEDKKAMGLMSMEMQKPRMRYAKSSANIREVK